MNILLYQLLLLLLQNVFILWEDQNLFIFEMFSFLLWVNYSRLFCQFIKIIKITFKLPKNLKNKTEQNCMSKVRLRDISVRETTSRDACQDIEKNLNANNVLKQISTINLSHLIQSFWLFLVLLSLGLPLSFLISSGFRLKRVLKVVYLVPAHCGPYMVMTPVYLVTWVLWTISASFFFFFFFRTPNKQNSTHSRIV